MTRGSKDLSLKKKKKQGGHRLLTHLTRLNQKTERSLRVLYRSLHAHGIFTRNPTRGYKQSKPPQGMLKFRLLLTHKLLFTSTPRLNHDDTSKTRKYRTLHSQQNALII